MRFRRLRKKWRKRLKKI
nr:antibacterial peptide [synthetic construct]